MAAGTTGISGKADSRLSDAKQNTSTQSLEDEADKLESGEEASSSEEEELAVPVSATMNTDPAASEEVKKWSGWPGESVFRLVVPVLKVGSIIGRKGDLIKKLCEETRARIRVLDGAIGTNDRIVLISAREEQDAEISPAMDAALRVFKRVNDISESTDAGMEGFAITSVRLLTPSSQAISLIGKQGTTIKSIQEKTGATIRVLSGDELPYYATGDERVVDIQGEIPKVLKALEAVVGFLRKFLVDRGVLSLFEKSVKTSVAEDHEPEAWSEKQESTHSFHTQIGNDYSLPVNQDSLYLDHEPQLDSQYQRSNLSVYGQDPAHSGLRSSGLGLGRSAGALVTQVTQTMQMPLSYAEDIVGIGGGNIAYIRRASGAVLTVQETIGSPDEITVEIKGTSSQVHMAHQIVQEFLTKPREPAPSSYGNMELRQSYSQLAGPSYSTSLPASSYGRYSGYGGYRL
ncbi:hypothetical protein KSP40_PGU003689 [Platanthera guangdongensis]|uniref:K Homology domain-containing protein n=1 Tax=Platanthera guangdongensis TaxID=2320717 RepID=A0ABR2LP26_9ASPA